MILDVSVALDVVPPSVVMNVVIPPADVPVILDVVPPRVVMNVVIPPSVVINVVVVMTDVLK